MIVYEAALDIFFKKKFEFVQFYQGQRVLNISFSTLHDKVIIQLLIPHRLQH